MKRIEILLSVVAAFGFAEVLLASVSPQDRSDGPRVLLIGDEIAQGYAPRVERLLEGEARVTFQWSGSSADGRHNISTYLRDGDWDVIHFNWGLHDIELTRPGTGRSAGKMLPASRPRGYGIQLQIVIDEMIKTPAHLIMATMTPVPPDAERHRAEDVTPYNEVAVEMAGRYGVTVNDLYRWTLRENMKPIVEEDGFPSFSPRDYEVLALRVAEAVREGLARGKTGKRYIRSPFSGEMRKDAVLETARAAADWQLAHKEEAQDDWIWATFYMGLLAVAEADEYVRYLDVLRAVGDANGWAPGPRRTHADDHAVGQLYLDLYRIDGEVRMIAPIRAHFDALLDEGVEDLWYWCDALFMSPPVLSRLSRITEDPRYLDYMLREWEKAMEMLYDREHRLYYRDTRRMDRLEKNGELMFWSRGNGWVLAALARVLEDIPRDHPALPGLVGKFHRMAERVTEIQPEDGLWRAGLLDPDSYDLPESSGTALFIYALAWGVNAGLLDRADYEPAIRRGWEGLVRCVGPDGMVGHVQPPGGGPGPPFGRMATYPYGVGAFLLAASEVCRMAEE